MAGAPAAPPPPIAPLLESRHAIPYKRFCSFRLRATGTPSLSRSQGGTVKGIRLLLHFLAAFLAAGGSASAAEQETPPPEENRLLALERFIGEWTIEANWSSGQPLRARAVYEWGLGKKIIKARLYVGEGEKEYQRYESVLAWHPQKRTLFEISFAFDGAITEQRIDPVDADTFRLGWSPFGEGEAPRVRQTLAFRGRDAHDWEAQVKSGEEWKTQIRGTWNR